MTWEHKARYQLTSDAYSVGVEFGLRIAVDFVRAGEGDALQRQYDTTRRKNLRRQA